MSIFKIIHKIVILILFFVSFAFILKTLFLSGYPDFNVYYYGSKIVISGGNVYLGDKQLFTSFVYPPFVALFFAPFTILPFFIAEKIWTLVSIVSLLLSLFVLFKIFKQKIFSSTAILLVSLSFLAFPVKFTLGMGQINLLILLFLVLTIFFANNHKDKTAGSFLGLSIALKLFPVLLLLYFSLIKRWKIIFFCLTIIISSLVLPLFFIKPEVNLYFIKITLPNLLGGWKYDYYNQSLSGFLGRTGWIDFREILRIFISVIFLGISFFAIINKPTKKGLSNLKIGILIILSLIINNFSWQHHFVWLIFPFFATFFFIKNEKLDKRYYVFLFLAYFLVAFNLKNPQIAPVILQSHVLYGAIILWALDIYLILKTAIDNKT